MPPENNLTTSGEKIVNRYNSGLGLCDFLGAFGMLESQSAD
jgi:hypothetical protein